MGFVNDNLVELDGGVHPPDVGVIPEGKQDFKKIIRENKPSPPVV